MPYIYILGNDESCTTTRYYKITQRPETVRQLRANLFCHTDWSPGGRFKNDYPRFRQGLKSLGKSLAAYLKDKDWGKFITWVNHSYNDSDFAFMGNAVFGDHVAMIRKFLPQVFTAAITQFDNNVSDNTWEAPVWATQPWWINSPARWLHCTHRSTDQPANIVFAENEAKLAAGRFTITKPGRYLARFFSNVLSEKEIKHWAERQVAGEVGAKLKFIEHDDKAGWVRVYKDGPSSCMGGDGAGSAEVNDCIHVYAHSKSVLRLAYLEDDGACIVARAIVRDSPPESKGYIRLYPNNHSPELGKWQVRMGKAVHDAGYINKTNLEGCLLEYQQISRDRRGNATIAMPYLDYGSLGDTPCVFTENVDGKTYMRVHKSHGKQAANTSGDLTLSDADEDGEDDRGYCSDCEESCDSNDMVSVYGGDVVCDGCADDHYVEAHVRRGMALVHTDNVVHCESNNEYYHEDFTDNYDIYYCEFNREWYHSDDMVETADGWVHADDAFKLDINDEQDNEHAHPNYTVETKDGLTIHKDEARTCAITGGVFHHSQMWKIYQLGDKSFSYIHPETMFADENWKKLGVVGCPEDGWRLIISDSVGYRLDQLPRRFGGVVSNIRVGGHEDTMSFDTMFRFFTTQLQLQAA